MTATTTILRFQIGDVLRSRWVMVYGILLLLLTDLLFRLAGTGDRVVFSLMNVVLLLVPLMSTVFGTMYLYHARDFTTLLLAQPVPRRSLFLGLYGGLTIPLTLAFVLGVGVPFLWHGATAAAGPLTLLLAAGALLTASFTALAFLVAVSIDDRAKGLGGAVLVWLTTGVVYDGVLLLVVVLFGTYPLERPLLALTFANPIDLARVLLLLSLDTAALMGYTGAVFQRFFGTSWGIALAAVTLLFWVAGPLAVGMRRFRRKDF